MGVDEVFIRNMGAEINAGTEAVPIWTNIGGIKGGSLPQPEISDEDNTKWSNSGVKSHKPAGAKYSSTLKGFYQEDESTGARDAGQEACEAMTGLFGNDGIKQFRLTSPGGTAKVAKASCVAGPKSADDDGLIPWECEIRFTEKPV